MYNFNKTQTSIYFFNIKTNFMYLSSRTTDARLSISATNSTSRNPNCLVLLDIDCPRTAAVVQQTQAANIHNRQRINKFNKKLAKTPPIQIAF